MEDKSSSNDPKEEADSHFDHKPKIEFPEPPDWEFKRPTLKDHPSNKLKDRNGYKSLGVGLAVGYALIGSIAGGWLVGYLVDTQLGTTFWQGIGVVIGLPIGVVGALIILSKSGK